MKQFFILGRNPELSRAEINAVLIDPKEILFKENILLTNSQNNIDIQELGGTLALGEISFQGTLNEIDEYLEKEELVPSDKFTYSLHTNTEIDIIKNHFKKNRQKAIQKNKTKTDYSILFYKIRDKYYLGATKQIYHYHDVEARDMNKPHRREALAISPRLSKILINLSGVKKGYTLLDPFCGVGAILMEALIKGINVKGSDKDEEVIKMVSENVNWLKENYNIDSNSKLEVKNARYAHFEGFDGIATETPLGILVKKRPSPKEADKIINSFQALIIPILKNLKAKKKPKCKIAITFPRINDKRANIKSILQKTGLKIFKGPILESRENQFIAREILVLK